MATNADMAARFAAVITPALTTNPPRDAESLKAYTQSLPKKLLRDVKHKTMTTYVSGWSAISFMGEDCADTFLPMGYGMSYAVRVAQIIWNTHALRPELWLTVNEYSNTTKQHKKLYFAAYNEACKAHGFEPVAYITRAAEDIGITRCAYAVLRSEQALDNINDMIRRADAPKLHEHTRYEALASAKHRVLTQLYLMTNDVPDAEVLYRNHRTNLPVRAMNHDAYIEILHDKLSTVTMLQALPLREMRAAIAGIRALEKD